MQFIQKTLPVFLFFIMSVSLQSFAQEQSPRSIASNFFNLMKQESYEEAAALFHYPKEYTAEQKESEFQSVQGSLKKYRENFGSVVEILDVLPDAKYIGVGVSGAGTKYWQEKKQEPPNIMIPCKLEKLDIVSIRILFSNIEDRWEIMRVDYSFIESDESKALLKKLLK